MGVHSNTYGQPMRNLQQIVKKTLGFFRTQNLVASPAKKTHRFHMIEVRKYRDVTMR